MIKPEANILIVELYKTGEIQNEQQNRNDLIKVHTQKMELPSKRLAQIANNTRSKREDRVLTVTVKSIHEEYLAQPFQTKNKQFKKSINFITGYIDNFNVTGKNNNFNFKDQLLIKLVLFK